MSDSIQRATRILGLAAAPLAASVAQGGLTFSDPTEASVTFASGFALPEYANASLDGNAVNGNQGVKLFGGFEDLLGQDAYDSIVFEASGDAVGQGYGSGSEIVPVAWEFDINFLSVPRGGSGNGLLWNIQYILEDDFFGSYNYSDGGFVFDEGDPQAFQTISGNGEIEIFDGFGTGTWRVILTVSFDSFSSTAHTLVIPGNSLDFGIIPAPSAALALALGAGLTARRRR